MVRSAVEVRGDCRVFGSYCRASAFLQGSLSFCLYKSRELANGKTRNATRKTPNQCESFAFGDRVRETRQTALASRDGCTAVTN